MKCGHWGMVFDAGNCQTSLDIITMSALIMSGMATVTLTVEILRGSAFTSSLSDCATAAWGGLLEHFVGHPQFNLVGCLYSSFSPSLSVYLSSERSPRLNSRSLHYPRGHSETFIKITQHSVTH